MEKGNKIVVGRKAVTSAGTAEQLVTTATACFTVIVSADLGNNNPVVIGNSDVIAEAGSQKGIVLVPGNNPVSMFIDDVSKIYVDSQSNGDAVCFAYFLA